MSDEASVIAAVRRSDQVYAALAARTEALRCARVYFHPERPLAAECNFVGDVELAAGEDALSEVQEFFAPLGSQCFRWTPSGNQTVDELERLLAPHGFERRDWKAYGLRENTAPREVAELRMAPARAMRRAFTALVSERSRAAGDGAAETVAAQLDRLNDPQYDAFVGVSGDTAIGFAALLQVGPIGRVCDVFVSESRRRKGVGAALLAYVVRTAGRWALNPLCARVRADDAGAGAFLRAGGWEACGTIPSLALPGAVEAGG